jgi:transcriptional regulator with XRE-family HTH domain
MRGGESMENFAEKFKAARKAAGLTQQGMEDQMQIPRRTVQDWEKGIMTPPPYVQALVLEKLAGMRQREAYNITPDDRARERHHINSYAPLEALEKIARENIPSLSIRVLMNGLDTMGNDAEDFFETSVWSIKEALVEAYLLGKKDAERD